VSILKCWNCHGFGLIPSEYPMESDADSESFTYGEECPICHGKPWIIVCLKKLWTRLEQMKSNYQLFVAPNEAELKKLLRKRAFYRFMFDLTILLIMISVLYLFILWRKYGGELR
jgi:hypothetical protein